VFDSLEYCRRLDLKVRRNYFCLSWIDLIIWFLDVSLIKRVWVLQDVNHVVVERAFCEIFTSSQLLTRHQAGQMLLFVIANCDVMCDLPCDVQDAIDSRLGRHSACSMNATLPQDCRFGKPGMPVESADAPIKNDSVLLAENVGKNI
jgi:hypothetical protein